MKFDTIELTPEQNERICQNINLVYYLVKKNYLEHPQREDLEQEGMYGLIKAVITFQEDRNIKFATYAAKCIFNEINMFLRKNNKHDRNAHFEDTVNIDSGGTELKVQDIIEDPKSSHIAENIAEKSESAANLENSISCILNGLPIKERLTKLFRISGLTQYEVANIVGVSQSYISRLEKKSSKVLKDLVARGQHIKEAFLVEVSENRIIITFETSEIANFKEVLSRFLIGVKESKKLLDFEISYTNGRAILQIPLEQEAFLLLAMLIAEIEDIHIKYINLGDEAEEIKATSGAEELADSSTSSKLYPEQKANLERVENNQPKGNDIPLDSSVANQLRQNGQTTAQNIEQSEGDSASEEPVSANVATILEIQNYAISLREFSITEIQEKFPKNHKIEISLALNSLLNKGTIIRVSKGNYKISMS